MQSKYCLLVIDFDDFCRMFYVNFVLKAFVVLFFWGNVSIANSMNPSSFDHKILSEETSAPLRDFSFHLKFSEPADLNHFSAYFNIQNNILSSDGESLNLYANNWSNGQSSFFDAPFFSTDTLRSGQRFIYSGYVMLTSSIAGHIYLYLRTCKTQDWSNRFKWSNIENTFTKPPEWEYDHWSFNYVVHPYMGSLTYLATRNRGGGIFESFLFAKTQSVIYEYFVSSSLHRPSINDIIITPLGGMIVGETIFRIKNRLLKTNHLTAFKKVLLTIMDPYEVFRYGFNYQRMLKTEGIK